MTTTELNSDGGETESKPVEAWVSGTQLKCLLNDAADAPQSPSKLPTEVNCKHNTGAVGVGDAMAQATKGCPGLLSYYI